MVFMMDITALRDKASWETLRETVLKRKFPSVLGRGRIELKSWFEIPAWQQEDNRYIETGYRYDFVSTRVSATNISGQTCLRLMY